ncbi:unnamed protein product [Lota lota]
MRITVIWISSLVISLFVESCHAQKMNIQWGPQSMMYLKGKHGKRYLSDNEDGVLKQGLEGQYATVKGYHRLREFKVSKPSEILCSENIFIQYLQDRYQA